MHKARVSSIGLILAGLLVGCGLGQPQPSTDNIQPTPSAELQSLPRQVGIECAANPRFDAAGVPIWELPGTKPSDPNSAYQGDRGRMIGVIQGCMEVTAVEYSWSETDQAFWVRVRNTNGLEGWIPAHLIDFRNP